MRSLLFVLLLTLMLSGRADTSVGILLGDGKPASRELAEALTTALQKQKTRLGVHVSSDLDELQGEGAKVLVAVGPAALKTALRNQEKRPVIAALVPRGAFENLIRVVGPGIRVGGVYLDQPEERQLLLTTLLPGVTRSVGVIRPAVGALSMPRLRAAAGHLKLNLIEESVAHEQDVGAAVQRLLGRAELLLASPDPEVFNPQTIQGILLGAYRARVPMVGFSPAFTRAGALMSLHTSVAQFADQLAEIAVATVATGEPPSPQWPRQFEVSVNRPVARSLGLELPPETLLADTLANRERTRSP